MHHVSVTALVMMHEIDIGTLGFRINLGLYYTLL